MRSVDQRHAHLDSICKEGAFLCAAMSGNATEAVTTQPKGKRSEVMAYVRQLDASAVLGGRMSCEAVLCCSWCFEITFCGAFRLYSVVFCSQLFILSIVSFVFN